MPSYKVYFETVITTSVTVNADNPSVALSAAPDEMPGDICGACSGWRQKWSREEGEYEPVAVVDQATGKAVWTAEAGD